MLTKLLHFQDATAAVFLTGLNLFLGVYHEIVHISMSLYASIEWITCIQLLSQKYLFIQIKIDL